MFCRVKKACMRDAGELERALDDVFGIWVTVRSCCEKRIETKICKVAKILRLSRTVNSFRSFIYPVYSLPTQQDCVLPVVGSVKCQHK